MGLLVLTLSCSVSRRVSEVPNDYRRALVSTALGFGDQSDYDTVNRGTAVRTENAVQTCMATSGFKYDAMIPASVTSKQLRSKELLAKAESVGFGMLEGPPPPPAESKMNDKYLANLDTDGKQKYLLQVGICKKQAAANDAQNQTLPPSLTTALADMKSSIAADSTMIRATNAYSSCMASHGYSAVDPNAAQDLVLERIKTTQAANQDLAPVRSFEIAVAVSNAKCVGPYLDEVNRQKLDRSAQFIEKYGSELPTG